MTDCPDCGVAPGHVHEIGCDVERCRDCGGQWISCGCDPKPMYGLPWTGEWPGAAECREYGFWCRWVEGAGWVTCAPDDSGAQPDLSRLHRECRWDSVLQKMVLPG